MLAILRPILSTFWRASSGTILLVVFAVSCAAAASVSAPYIFSRQIDALSSNITVPTALNAFLLYGILMGVGLTLDRVVQYLSVMCAENLSYIASISFFSRLTKKSPEFFIHHNSAEIQSALRQGDNALGNMVNLGLIVIVPGLLKLVLSLVVMGAAINLQITLIVLAYGIFFIGLIYLSNKWIRKNMEVAISAAQENSKFVGNAVAAMETLRYFNSTNWVRSKFDTSAQTVLQNWRAFSFKRIKLASFFGIALAAQFSITFFLLVPQYEAGALSVGDIVLFNALLLQLNLPFEMIGMAIDEVVKARSKLKPFSAMWNAPNATNDNPTCALEVSDGSITYDHVSYAYDCSAGVSNINFSAERGRITFLIGPTGSGKSTVLKLLLKSLEQSSGSIKIDGQHLSSINSNDWYSIIGVVPQDIVLLNDSLKNNIVLGRTYSDDKLKEATRRAAILERIEKLPDGFDTNVGERGLKLSGGERQRIAIARALYENPHFLFLDEASSALDAKTEALIMDQLRKVAEDVTIIAITHRMNAIRSEDEVVELAAPNMPKHSTI